MDEENKNNKDKSFEDKETSNDYQKSDIENNAVNSNKEEPNNSDIENNQQTIQEETKKSTDIDSDTPSEKNEQPNELKQDKKTSTLEETKNVGDNDTSLTSKEEITENSNKNEDNPNFKWYAVQAHSGFEEKAVQNIKENAKKKSLDQFFSGFEIPKHDAIEMRRGKKVKTEKKFFPGYMLVKMIMSNETWQLVKKSNKVSGFVGNDHRPVPLSDLEAVKMLKKSNDKMEYIESTLNYEVGEQVKVCDGPFASFNGIVEEVDESKSKLKISVSIFGRSTPVELDYAQVEKM